MREQQYFEYGETEVAYLKERCTKLAWAIDEIGHIDRPVIPDTYEALVNSIIGQQISTAAHKTVWTRTLEHFGGALTPQAVTAASDEE